MGIMMTAEQYLEVVFDKELNYLKLNKAACEHLKVKPADIIGKNILSVYPDVVASKNHRNLLKALNGLIVNDFLKGRLGDDFHAFYKPIMKEEQVIGVFVKAIKL
jgi:hypothetical protein